MKQKLRSGIVYLLVMTAFSLGSPMAAHAEIIGTLTSLESQQRTTDLATVNAALSRTEVRAQFTKLGVDAAVVDMRVANLTDSELRQLAQQIDTAPAGGSVWAVIGIAAVVLLILELTGVIDWIKGFP
jgi:hypothetical protein